MGRTPAALSLGSPTNTDSNPVITNSVNSIEGETPISYVQGVIEGTVVPMLLDSGSSVSLISADFRMSVPSLRNRPLKKDYVSARAVNGQMLDTLGTIPVILCLGTESWHQTVTSVRREVMGLTFEYSSRGRCPARRQRWSV